jgi:hypothetical protein
MQGRFAYCTGMKGFTARRAASAGKGVRSDGRKSIYELKRADLRSHSHPRLGLARKYTARKSVEKKIF